MCIFYNNPYNCWYNKRVYKFISLDGKLNIDIFVRKLSFHVEF